MLHAITGLDGGYVATYLGDGVVAERVYQPAPSGRRLFGESMPISFLIMSVR